MSTFRDPYLEWSELTEFGGHAAMHLADARIPLLIEADAAQRAALRAQQVAVSEPPQPDCGFCTALALPKQLAAIEATVSAMEMSLPISVPEAAQAAEPPVPPSSEPVIAVIDHGCALLHHAFREDAEHTRLLALWDQGHSAAKTPWQRPQGFGYGRELGQMAINTLLRRLASGDADGEPAIYASLDYLLEERGALREAAHGTHVLDTLGGAIDARPPISSAKPTVPDAASRAPLIFVDVPSQAAGDSTGASNAAFLLDALRYIRSRAGDGVPVIANISLGAFAGPHDGTSLVERAIDDFLARDGQMALTIAAGNAALERWHASGTFAADDAATLELRWRTMPEDGTDSFVELWFDAANGAQQAQLAMQVVSPDGRASDWVQTADSATAEVKETDGGRLIAAVIARRPAASGGSGLFLLAVGPTAGPRRVATPGAWRIRLKNANPAVSVRFDAWIQRDEPAWDTNRGSVQSYFDGATRGIVIGDAAGGLSNLATGQQTIVVGATRAEDGQLSRYCSVAGRDRRTGMPGREIDAAASADESNTAIGLLAAAVRSNTLVRMGGTSVAAPVAARCIYDDFAGRRATAAAQRPSTPQKGLAQAQRDRVKALSEKTTPPRGSSRNALRVSLLQPKNA